MGNFCSKFSFSEPKSEWEDLAEWVSCSRNASRVSDHAEQTKGALAIMPRRGQKAQRESSVETGRKTTPSEERREGKKPRLVAEQTSGRVANRGTRKASSEDANQPIKHGVDQAHRQASMGAAKPSQEHEQLPCQGAAAAEGYPAPAENSDEDLYRGADELEEERKERLNTQPGSHYLIPRLGEGVSVEPSVDLLSYCEKEWRGNTAKSALIRKGYMTVAQLHGRLRRVRGDNYCALRAALFQVLSRSTRLPPRLHHMDITASLEADKDLIGDWRFPFINSERTTTGGAMAQLQVYLELLRDRWLAAVQAGSASERESLCQQVFQGHEEEYGLLEALKFLMLQTARELHGRMGTRTAGVPEFCWLLFARDSSSCPGTLFRNHLRHVGFTGGLEQVEMFLLGYSLEHTIQVYRLYKSHTEEFITYYPDDHREDWPCLPLLTEDDRHYNVPVA